MEGSCKFVVDKRFKGNGMRWKKQDNTRVLRARVERLNWTPQKYFKPYPQNWIPTACAADGQLGVPAIEIVPLGTGRTRASPIDVRVPRAYHAERGQIMDELKKVLDIALVGEQREKVIEEFKGYLAGWGMTMPPAEMIVQDFGLGDFRQEGLVECWVANEMEAGYCGKFLFLFEGQTCPMHHHRTKHETFYIVHGTVNMTFGGETRVMKPGEVLPVPPGKPHSFRGISAALLLEVSKPCFVDDNYFANPRIPIGGSFRGS